VEVNDIRSAVTVIGLILFLGIVAWAWSRSRRADFDEAARLPFAEEEHKGAAK
jgi:cytochrome c oxidase cbb3-type subunit 4